MNGAYGGQLATVKEGGRYGTDLIIEKGIALILLAAGDSRRFGENKLLYQIEGRPMYRYAVSAAAEAEGFIKKKVIVTQYEEIGQQLAGEGFEVVINRESHLGISHSIHLALERFPEFGAYCFMVCDQPWLTGRSLKRLLEGFLESHKGLGCLTAGNELGNPAVFAASYREELLKLQGDKGGKRVIVNHLDDLYLCQAEDIRELQDVDRKE